MVPSHVPFGAALAICLATASCAAPSNNEQAMTPAPPPELEEALSYSVDALDVRHGTLRIEASMTDGSADVSMWLGDACEAREVGHGIATRSGFAWSLSRDEVARAIECNLVVNVHAVDEDGQRVRRTALLPVSVSLQEDGAESVRILRQEAMGAATKLTFGAAERARRLHVAGTIIGVEPDDEEAPRNLFLSSFVVDNDDLARSMLGRRHLSLLGEHFLTTVTVGSMTLDVLQPEPEVAVVSSDGEG